MKRPTRRVGQGLRPVEARAPADGAVLLDTNVVIRAQLDLPLTAEGRAAIEAAQASGGLLISVVTAWELALLARNPESRTGRLFQPDVRTWFQTAMRAPGVREAPMNAAITMDSWALPEPIHSDPADRLLIATARHVRAPLLTRDRTILAYAEAGHVRAVAC